MGSSGSNCCPQVRTLQQLAGNALHRHVPCTVYLTTQARILHVDWLVAGRNRYRSTSTIASTAAALGSARVPCRAVQVQYSTIHAAQVSRGSPHLTLTLYRNNSERIRSMANGPPNHVGTCPLSIAWEVLQ
jgi:hypothetical protein